MATATQDNETKTTTKAKPATPVPAPAPTSSVDGDREYVVLVLAAEVIRGGEGDSWEELGTVSAETRPLAWEKAKAKWSELTPPTPASADEAAEQEPVRCKVVPARNFVTIESRVEYVAPRAVATGV